MKHQKHAKLTRPAFGEFARQEWAILGTPCGVIQELSRSIISALGSNHRMAYIDADHQSGDEPGDVESMLGKGAALEYTDKIHFHRLDWKDELNVFHQRPLYNQVDGVLVNGNHFIAKRQIVVIDPKKLESLRRKFDRLTDVGLVLLAEGVTNIPEDVLQAMGENAAFVPVFSIKEKIAITNWLQEQLSSAKAPLQGLVLAGGKSQRMGKDKGLIDYHGLPQREYLAKLLSPLCSEVYLSCAPGQASEMGEDWPVIEDSFLGLGPFGAILSAFREQPDSAWLVVACDLPLLDEGTMRQLIKGRDSSEMATAFHNPATGFPDPLVTIWEPRAYPILLSFLTQGYSCPRKVLINSSIKELQIKDPQAIRNVNRPEELEEVIGLLKNRSPKSFES